MSLRLRGRILRLMALELLRERTTCEWRGAGCRQNFPGEPSSRPWKAHPCRRPDPWPSSEKVKRSPHAMQMSAASSCSSGFNTVSLLSP